MIASASKPAREAAKKKLFLIFHPGNEHDFDIQSSRFHCLPGFFSDS